MDWCLIIPAICFLIGALLGYLLGKYLGSKNTNTVEIEEWRTKYTNLEKELAECRSKVAAGSDNNDNLEIWKKKSAALEADLAACRAEVASNKTAMAAGFAAGAATSGFIFDGNAAKSVYGKTIKEDDLKVVEGIGPKIEELFQGAGIKTWKMLSETSVEKCQEILNTAGERFRVHNPGSWPKQAKLAYEGKWVELFQWQKDNNYGKEK